MEIFGNRIVIIFVQIPEMSQKKVAKSFGVSLRPIKRILNKNNIELTNRRFNVNHSYFNVIDSEDKAYWLGFLFADGCVRKTKTGAQLVLKLSAKDENHLIKFKNDLNSEHKIFYNVSKTTSKKGTPSVSNNCVIRVNSGEMVEDLINQGCVPRKTFIIDYPNISEEFYKDFITSKVKDKKWLETQVINQLFKIPKTI